MTKLEERIADFIMDHFTMIAYLTVTAIGILVRVPMRGFVSADARVYLLPWYEEIRASGIAQQVGNYNLPYQLAIFLMTKLPIAPLYGYKLLSCVFDLLLASICVAVMWELFPEKKKHASLLVYCAVLISPVVVLNSAAWAQCDSIYVFFALCGVYLLMKDRTGLSMFCFGLSLAFKLQAVFFFPALIMIYFMKRNFSASRFLLIPLAMVVVSVPMLFAGRSPLELLRVYVGQTREWPMMANNYPSLYLLFGGENYDLLAKPAILFTVTGLGALFYYIACNRVKMTKENMVMLLFLCAYTCVLFLPAMHERYGYPYEILAWILVFLVPKTAPLCIGLQLMTLRTYSTFLFNTGINLTALAWGNVAIYVLYVILLLKEMRRADQ